MNKYLLKIAEKHKAGKVPKGKVYHQYQLESFERGMKPTDKRLIINYRYARKWNADG